MEGRETRNAARILARKELKLLFKSKRRIFLLTIMPIIILLMALIMGFSVRNFEENQTTTVIQVLDETPTNYTSGLIQLWEEIENSKITMVSGDYLDFSTSSKLEVFAYIPANFSTSLTQELTASIFIFYSSNTSDYSLVATQVYQYTVLFEQILIQTENPDVQFNRIEPNIERIKYEGSGLPEELASQVFIIPVYIIFFLVFPPINLVLISVTLEREQKTLETLFLQPVKRRSIIQGKVLYGMSIVGITTLLNLLSATISVITLLFLLNGSENDASKFVSEAIDTIGIIPIIAFTFAIVIIAMNIIALAVLVSLLAKDEKEANMISGLLPLIIFSSIIIVMFVPIGDFSSTFKLILSLVPVIGILVAIYLSTIAGEVTLLGYVSLLANTLWGLFFIWVTTRLSEAESILELTWGKAFGEFLKMLKLKKHN